MKGEVKRSYCIKNLMLWEDASVIPPFMRLWQEGGEFKASLGTQKDIL